jgi:hypothetical protein
MNCPNCGNKMKETALEYFDDYTDVTTWCDDCEIEDEYITVKDYDRFYVTREIH